MHYILNDDNNAVLEPDMFKWAEWFETGRRKVARDEVGDAVISTVFIGMSVGSDMLLWESMIFGGRFNDYQHRHSSHQEALTTHAILLKDVTKSQTLETIVSYGRRLDYEGFREWAELNLTGEFYAFACERSIGFEKKSDAALFMLTHFYNPED